MTPTLIGRWQTRILLFIVLGLPITALYAQTLDPSVFYDPFVFLTALLIVGLLLDPFYTLLQRLRWDNDWPFAFQLFFFFIEFAIALGVMEAGLLDMWLTGRIPLEIAFWHFLWVIIPTFISLLAGVQLFLVRWRFKGGELGRL